MTSSGENSRYRYLRVSASQNDCCVSSLAPLMSVTSRSPAKPPDEMRQCFWKAWKIRQPASRHFCSRVMRQRIISDSTVSGRSKLWLAPLYMLQEPDVENREYSEPTPVACWSYM